MKKNKKEKKEINKDIKNVKGLFTSILVILAKAIYILIKNLIYIGYVLIYNFDNLIAKMFMKLPRILRVIGVYSLVTISIIYFIELDKNTQTEAKESKISTIEQTEEIKDEEKEFEELEKIEEKEEKYTCKLGEIECKIYNSGISKGMTHKQALLVVAISRHETGNWTSSAFRNKNNFGGMMCKGSLATYKSFDEGLDKFTTLLNDYYFAKGRNTIEKIGAIYCPVGAKNDPNGLNQNWIPNVTKYYNEYLNM